MPSKWEDKVEPQNLVIFRYKCGCGVYSVNSGPTTDASTVYLALQQRGDEVTVSFGALPASNASAHSSMRKLVIQLSSAINLDGFQKASSKCAVSRSAAARVAGLCMPLAIAISTDRHHESPPRVNYV